jgi:hypothetical protein
MVDTAIGFERCDFCGLRSALVDTENGKLLVVDRRMPYLKRRCQELSQELPDVTIVVDRRIAQDPFHEEDRRLVVRETSPS